MRRLIVFNQVSLDGYFVDAYGDMSWAHAPTRDAEWQAFVEGNASRDGVLVFGRITYELMAGYWPTPAAARDNPVVAARMNDRSKIVFSRTLERPAWNNTTLVRTDPAAEIPRRKQDPGPDLVILGSGTLVCQLTRQRLIDEYQLVVIPLILGRGRTLFEGLPERLPLQLLSTRTFTNGNVLLCYQPQTERAH